MPNCRLPCCLAALAACLACCCAASADGLRAIDETLLADARDGALDRFDLPSACLIAGGASDERELMDQRRRLDSACETIVRPILASAEQERARQLFELMHSQLLTGR